MKRAELTAAATLNITGQKYQDRLINDFITLVRDVPLESDAVSNIPVLIKAYERRKSLKQKLKDLI